MVSNAPTGVRAALTSSATTWTDADPAAIRLDDTHWVVSVLASGDHVIGAPSRRMPFQSFQLASSWEAALIAVLFLLISGLVGLRAAELLSEDDVRDPSCWLRTEESDDSGERNRSHDTSDSRDDHRWGTEYDNDHDHDQNYHHQHYISPETPPDLLSDEGNVVRLLVEHGGRIRQHRIADETGWSKSKVSRICSQMHADGRIEKRSVGRENVISLSEVDPADGDEPTHDSDTGSDDLENPLT
ncbi:MarR family transcriptional regulator [Halobiforma lacisalsi AJ5]|uniref:MarR family transcriptional regulator n=1 Tax=Natronobacterium lacisalsi AJ5 TaxID=358396 RepID=M0LPS7_NATLA|nr:helix-turn-helix domain-containing protein [Halobiforma lacisalsi]APW97135.1 MarR family transcriptional regulator [Halobiforma lacisalsi AJ5]EMA34474.1 hypothetical protein C445_08107 [Halobiforma lacisalsi AJ5]